MSNPNIKVFELEKQNKGKPCEDWFYCYEGAFTRILNENSQTVTIFYKKLSFKEVYAFRAGWGVGQQNGIILGQMMKSEEIRKKLNI